MGTSAAKIGVRGTGSYTVTGERPESWREGIMYLFPNGQAPLTAMLGNMKGEAVTDPVFHWFTQEYINKGDALSGSGVYTDLGFGTALTATTSAAGTQLAARCTQKFSTYLRPGQIVLLRQSNDHSNDMQARIVSVIRGDDTTSGFAFVTLKLDGEGNGSLVDADRVLLIGSAHGEGAARPEAISYVPVEHYNYTQIFRTSLRLTRTAMKTRLRTEDAYKKAKKEALQDHSVELEDGFLWGERTLGTDDSGEPLRTTMGIIPFIRNNYPTNVLDCKLHTDYAGMTWAAYGKAFLDMAMEMSFRWGNSSEKMFFTGNAGLLAIQQIVEANSMYQIRHGEKAYGIGVTKLDSAFGTWNIKTHPRFTIESSNNRSGLLFEMESLKYRYVDDTTFMVDEHFRKGGGSGYDAKNEEFLTEAGLEMHHPEKFMYISNLGLTNTAS